MRLTSRFAALVIAAFPCAFAADESYESLFNGRDLSGWKGDTRYWSVENGEIVGRTTPQSPLAENTFLIRDGVFADFELVLEFKIVGGNSGVQYRSRVVEGFTVGGYQADMEDGPNYTGMLYEEKGRGILCWRGSVVDLDAGGGRREDKAKLGDPAKLMESIRLHDWNEYKIVAHGSQLTHFVNGVKMIDVRDRQQGNAAREGVIAFQIHTGGPMEVRYRKVNLKRLSAVPVVDEPQWIWSKQPIEADSKCVLTRVFELKRDVKAATLTVSCDNHHVTKLNGQEVVRGDEWQKPDEADVTSALRAGRNEIEVACRNDGGPAALAVSLLIEFPDGSMRRVVSDDSWREGTAEVATFGPISRPNGPWPNPMAEIEATPAEAIQVPPGFVIERLASAKRNQGSWVSMTFDAKGRIILSPQSGPLLRATLDPNRGMVPTIEPLGVPLGDAHGLLVAGDSLYVVKNGDISDSGLFRCRDLDGDDRYEDVQRLFAFGPGGEHGGHGIVLGPDGDIYFCLGNHTENFADGVNLFGPDKPPRAFAPTSPLRNYAEDMPLARAWDPNGHAVSIFAPGGVVVRGKPDGSSFELFAGGFRNHYDIAFSPDGELFTFDSDMEWDIGLPWYREIRVCHVVSGADYGWRSGSGNWPAYYFDSLPPAVDVGHGSPTGVVFTTKTNFPDPYRSALLINDWTYGRIVAVWLEPDGSSYRGRIEPFATGQPLNVTDIEVGPDGAIYFITGGRGTQSGLYRVSAPPGSKPGAIARNESSDPARAARRALEKYQRNADPKSIDPIFAALDSSDRFLSSTARVALERQDLAGWKQRALQENRPIARDVALLALVRTDITAFDAVASRLTDRAWDSLSKQAKLDELRTLEVGFARQGSLSDATRGRLLERLDARFPTGDFDIDRELYAVLRNLGAPKLTSRTLDRLQAAKDPQEQIYFAWVLRDVTEAWSESDKARYQAAGQALRALSGGHSFAGYLDLVFGAAERVPVEMPKIDTEAPPKWTLDNVVPELVKVDSGRSFDQGRAVFSQVLCAQCHRVGTEGGSVGPDLTGVASRFSRRDLLESILDPSKVISDQYQTIDFEMKDGSHVNGRIVDEDFFGYVVLVEPLNPRRVNVLKAEVAKKGPSKVSQMPARLLDSLTLEQVLDLMAYLEAGGKSTYKSFRN